MSTPRKASSSLRFAPWTWSREIGPDPAVERRQLRRLVLFVVLVILLTVWFQLHIQPFVTEVFFVGGTLTLWGLWKIAQSSWAEWGSGGKPQKGVRGWLARPLTGELLALGLILAGLLFMGTSSIYGNFEGARPGEDSYKVEILELELKDGHRSTRPLTRLMEVTSTKRLDGRPFFLRWRPVQLELRITNQPGWEPLPKSFWPGMPLRLDVPGDFERRRLRLLRLVPGSGLIGDELARPEAETSGHSLLMVIGGEKHKVSDLRFQTIYLGGSAEDLKWAVGEEDRERFHQQLEEYFQDELRLPREYWPDYFPALEGAPLPFPDAHLPKSGKILIQIHLNDRLLRSQEIEIKDEDGIQTEFIETL